MIWRRFFAVTSVFTISFVLVGCLSFSGSEPPYMQNKTVQPATLSITLFSSELRTPIAVYLFELENKRKFMRLDLDEIVQEKYNRYKNEIIRDEKVIIPPNKVYKEDLSIDKNVRYFAIVVAYANASHDSAWRYIKKIKPNTHNDITLQIAPNGLIEIENINE